MHVRSALLLALCASAVQAAPHITPWRDPAAPPAAPAANAHLNYYGGRILDQVKVYSVNWGNGVNEAVASRIGAFYGAITSSAMFDWLAEYDTVLSGGTNQRMKHGSFAGNITITPSNTSTTLTDEQIKAEIQAQQSKRVLPGPDGESLFMINFPAGIKITLGTANSCQSGGFCAYHNTIATSPNTYYGVLPDMSPGSGCDVGCGHAATMFDNYTSVASHELIEGVTDPGVGLATSYAPPLAWYDPSNGEIGDICNAQQGTFQAGTVTYTVQKEWSNLSGACIGVTGSDAFAVSISPSSQNLSAGSSVNYTVSAPVLRGSAQSVSLSVSGLPSGVAGSFNPSTITTGATSTLTLSAGSSAVNGAATFTVSGAGSVSNASGSAQVNVSGGKVNCPPGTHDSGGVCVPDGGGGCSSRTAGFLGFAALSLALLFARRRRA
jgi:hypothetical protein